MGYWNSEINGFVPYQNKEKTFIEYTDEQIKEIMQQVTQGGRLTTGEDGHVNVVPRPEPTAEEKQPCGRAYPREIYNVARACNIASTND